MNQLDLWEYMTLPAHPDNRRWRFELQELGRDGWEVACYVGEPECCLVLKRRFQRIPREGD